MNLKKYKPTRTLGVFNLVMINVIAIDSIRHLPVNAANGPSLLVLYVIATCLFLIPCILVTAELATHYPQSGGVYIWVREAFGPSWGFLSIWLQWIYNIFWYPTILSFIATNIAYLIHPSWANQKIFILSAIILMFLLATFCNARGMKISSIISTICAVGGTLIPMMAIIILAAGWLLAGKPVTITSELNQWTPHFTHMPNIAFLVIILFSLMGFEMSSVHAESVKNPQRDFPKALFYSALIVVLSLIMSSLGIMIVIPSHTLNIISGLNDAFKIFLTNFHLDWFMPILILLIIIGGFGGMAAWVIGPTKGLIVAAEDGIAPKILRQRNSKGAPIAILIMQAIIVIILSGLFLCFKSISTSYWILSVLTSQLALLFYISLFAAAIKLRKKTPENPHAFQIPGGVVGIWLVGTIGILTCCGAILLGFIPPADVVIENVTLYEAFLIIGILFFSLIPFAFHNLSKYKIILGKKPIAMTKKTA